MGQGLQVFCDLAEHVILAFRSWPAQVLDKVDPHDIDPARVCQLPALRHDVVNVAQLVVDVQPLCRDSQLVGVYPLLVVVVHLAGENHVGVDPGGVRQDAGYILLLGHLSAEDRHPAAGVLRKEPVYGLDHKRRLPH